MLIESTDIIGLRGILYFRLMQDRQPLIDPTQQMKPVAMAMEGVDEHDFSTLLGDQSKMRADDKEVGREMVGWGSWWDVC